MDYCIVSGVLALDRDLLDRGRYFAYLSGVEKLNAMQIMSALSQPTRWEVYNLLVGMLPAGMAASEIAKAVGMSRTAMSPHFAILSAAGLLSSTKSGRHVTYRAETEPVAELSDFLTHAVKKGRSSIQ